MKKEKGIKSPYSETIVKGPTDLVDSGKHSLAKFLMHIDRLGEPVEMAHVGGFFAGFQAGLLAIGLPIKTAKGVTTELLDQVEDIRQNGCGECANCKANKKKK